MSHKALNLTTTLYQYVLDHNPPISDLLLQFHAATLAVTGGSMVIPLDQMHFMQFLLKWIRANNVLELGTFTGFSAAAFALALPAQGLVTTCDISDKMLAIGRSFWDDLKVADRIEFVQSNGLDFLDHCFSSEKRYDFIFIDADKKNLNQYLEKSLPLLSEKGLIVVDNTLFKGDVADESIHREIVKDIRCFNDKLQKREDCEYCLLPLGDGLTLVRPHSL